MKELGASAVSTPDADVYPSIEKGIIDGTWKGESAIQTGRLAEVAKYTINAKIYPAPTAAVYMNWNSYNKLPKDIQKIIDDSLPQLQANFITAWVASVDTANKYAKPLGHEWIELSPEDMTKFYSLLEVEARDVAKGLDAKGLPATKILERVLELCR